jgi:hypothetical protein
MATVHMPANKLTGAELASMQALPNFEVSFQLPLTTLKGALKRTDFLATQAEQPDAVSAAAWSNFSFVKHACTPEATHACAPALVSSASKCEHKFDTASYLGKESGLYRIASGASLLHCNNTLHATRVLFDTCSEVNMLSKQYADANGILYGPCPTMIHTSVGSAGGVVGQVLGPVYSVLNPGTDVECSTSSKDGITFLVAQGVDPLYEV